MATAMYLEHCLDSLESLPAELQRNFNLMRDLDRRTQDLLKDIDQTSETYLAGVTDLSQEERSEKMTQINKMFTRSKQYGDEKVQLASQTYEMVDKHIRRLDSDLARFEAEVRSSAQLRQNTPEVAESSSTDKKSSKKDGKSTSKRPADESSSKKSKSSKRKSQESSSPESSPSPKQPVSVSGLPPILSLGLGTPSDVLDMPVDPNEPTYCVCHQVSYGEMIGCDNPDCPVEWFHFGCVGLTAKPKGKWFCPRCTEEKKRKHTPAADRN